jgi:hypothetical protein
MQQFPDTIKAICNGDEKSIPPLNKYLLDMFVVALEKDYNFSKENLHDAILLFVKSFCGICEYRCNNCGRAKEKSKQKYKTEYKTNGKCKRTARK